MEEVEKMNIVVKGNDSFVYFECPEEDAVDCRVYPNGTFEVRSLRLSKRRRGWHPLKQNRGGPLTEELCRKLATVPPLMPGLKEKKIPTVHPQSGLRKGQQKQARSLRCVNTP